MRWAVERTAPLLPSESASATRERAASLTRRALRDALATSGSATATPSATCTRPTSASTPRAVPTSSSTRLDRGGRDGPRDRERARHPGDAVRRRDEPRRARDPGAGGHQPRPHPTRPDRRDLARQPDRDRAGRRDPPRAHARGRRARAVLPASIRAPTRRSAAWRRRTPPARRRCATGRCARTSWRSRPSSPTGG